jgi:integrase
VVGHYRLQKLSGAQIDSFYATLASKAIAQRTKHQVHIVLGAALKAAVRAGALSVTPMDRALNIPPPGDINSGIALDEDQLKTLVDGFRGSSLHLFVAILAGSGMRRNEALGLQWRDFDETNKTLKIERAIERTTAGGITFKLPKTARGVRKVAIDNGLVELLRAERERHLRLVAGVPDGAAADLRMIKLPTAALILPSPAGGFDLTRPRHPHDVTQRFVHRARMLGFDRLRLHDLRGSHITQLLRRGVALDVVARRCGHDVKTMMTNYAKVLPSDDAKVRETLAEMARTSRE